jgi:hypothetical protein
MEDVKSQFGVCFESIKTKVEEDSYAKMTGGEI